MHFHRPKNNFFKLEFFNLFPIYEGQYLFPSDSFPVMCFVTNVKITILLVQTSVLVEECEPNQRQAFEHRRVIKIFASIN